MGKKDRKRRREDKWNEGGKAVADGGRPEGLMGKQDGGRGGGEGQEKKAKPQPPPPAEEEADVVPLVSSRPPAKKGKKQGAAAAAPAPAPAAPAAAPAQMRIAAKEHEFIELTERRLMSRLLYSNPVCVMTTVSVPADWEAGGGAKKEGRTRRNAMALSWLTPMNNDGTFVFCINQKRLSAQALLAKRPFVLSVPTAGAGEKLVRAVGGCSGRHVDKFAAAGGVAGLEAVPLGGAKRFKAPPRVGNKAKAGKGQDNPFSALGGDDSSDDDDGDGDDEKGVAAASAADAKDVAAEAAAAAAADQLRSRHPPAAVAGTVAHMECRVLDVATGHDGKHFVVTASMEAAHVRWDYWLDGKTFVHADGLPPTLTFLGATKFGYTCAQAGPAAAAAAEA